MSNLSNLGTFQLGQVQLGASLGNASFFDSYSMSETIVGELDVYLQDSYALTEVLDVEAFLELVDAYSLAESGSFPTEGWAGVLAKIVQAMDVTSIDFCAMVEESGQSLEVNSVPERAYFFIKQRQQRFTPEIEIDPGDAVMHSCPDLVIAIGDVVTFLGIDYTIVAIIPHTINGNIIYNKSACKLEVEGPSAPGGLR